MVWKYGMEICYNVVKQISVQIGMQISVQISV